MKDLPAAFHKKMGNYSEPIRKIAATQLFFCSCGVLAK